MKKVAVVYSSKFGHTKQYADWLKEDIADLDVIDLARFNPTQLMAYKLIVFACGVYGDKLSIMDFIKKNITAVPVQKMMIMAVSWYTNDSEDAKRKLIEDNYPEQLKRVAVPIFIVNSGINKKALSPMDKMMLKAAQISIDKKEGRSSDDINALAIIKGYSDQTSKDNLASIKKAINEFFEPAKKAAPAENPRPAAAAPAPKPVNVSDVSEMKNGADALNSLENAFKALKAPKEPAPKPVEPAPKPVEPAPKPVEPAPKPIEPAPKPVEPAPKPVEAASKPVEAAPKPVEAAPKPAEVAPAQKAEQSPKAASQPSAKTQVDSMRAAVASSVKDAIAALSSGDMPAYTPAPTFELDEENTDKYSEAVADSIMLANQAVAQSAEKAPEKKQEEAPEQKSAVQKPAAPAPEPVKAAPAPELKREVKPEAEAKSEPSVHAAEPKPAQSDAALKLEKLIRNAVPEPPKAAPMPEPSPEPKVEQPAAEKPQEPVRKNSYMELFAKRRRRTEEATSETSSAAENAFSPAPAREEEKPAPVVPKAVERPAPAVPQAEERPAPAAPKAVERPAPTVSKAAFKSDDRNIIDFDFIMDEEPPAPVKEAEKSEYEPAVASIDMDVYDFISEDSKPRATSRALNAVQDLAKAKAEAEKEKQKAAEKQREAAEQASTESGNSIIEKMKRDIETLAEESEHEIEAGASESVQQEDDEGLEGFMFSNDVDYDLDEEFAEPVMSEEERAAKDNQTNLDIKKLQEEINASIEINRATKEKMEARFGKKVKEEPHNPFAVQFEEEESTGKKKKKAEEPRKRLEDPIDPDIFFNRPGKKELDMTPGAMPEIKFRRK